MSSLVVSAGSVDITPTIPVELAGFEGRLHPFQKVHDRIEAAAVKLLTRNKQVVIVSLDLLYGGAALRKILVERLGERVSPDELLLFASHTHFAPTAEATKPMIGGCSREYFEYVSYRVAGLVDRLLRDDGENCEVHYGHQFTNNNTVNRRLKRKMVFSSHRIRFNKMVIGENRCGPKDENLRVLSFKNSQGRIPVVIWNFSCHPVIFPLRNQVSAEYPGVVRARLREAWGKQISVIFIQGFSGDVRPLVSARSRSIKNMLIKKARGGFNQVSQEEWRVWADDLGEKTKDAVLMSLGREPEDLDGGVRVKRVEIPLSEIVSGGPADRGCSFTGLAIGQRLGLVGISAEVVTQYGDVVRKLMPGRFLLLGGCMDDTFGYLPTKSMIAEGGYESGGFFRAFSLPTGFTPDFEEVVRKAIGETATVAARPADFFYSREDLAKGLRQLGICRGDTLKPHAALKSIGPVREHRGNLFIEVLQDVVGPEGTIVVLTFSPKQWLPWLRKGPQINRMDTPANTGGLANTMMGRKGAFRSAHPVNSWTAMGRNTQMILSEHNVSTTAFSPIDRFMESEGKFVTIGYIDCGSSFSTIHRIQEQLALAYRSIKMGLTGAWYNFGAGERLFVHKDVSGCSRGFVKFYPYYVHRGKLRIGWVGDAVSMCIDSREAYKIERPMIEKYPRFPLCENPRCFFCRGTLYYNMRDWPGFYFSSIGRYLKMLFRFNRRKG